jgi:hypothetical protein
MPLGKYKEGVESLSSLTDRGPWFMESDLYFSKSLLNPFWFV